MTLLQDEMHGLKEAIDLLTKRKTRKRRYIRTEETLTVGEVVDTLAPDASSVRSDGKGPSKRVQKERRYRRCLGKGHNIRTYTVLIEDISDSDASSE